MEARRKGRNEIRCRRVEREERKVLDITGRKEDVVDPGHGGAVRKVHGPGIIRGETDCSLSSVDINNVWGRLVGISSGV